jgi:protein SCO1
MMTRRVPATLVPVLAVAALLAVPAPAAAQFRSDSAHQSGAAPASKDRPAAGIEEKVGGQVPLDLVFRDEDEQPVTLGQCTGGKTTILVPVYYRCPMLCNEVLNKLLEALREMPQDYSVGDKFNVVTVSMDDREHCDLARAKKKAYLDEYARPGAAAGWRFLTGTKPSIAALLDSVGYRFEFDKVFKEYNHPTGIILLTPSGKVARYFQGLRYSEENREQFKVPGGTTTLRLSLVEASEGKIGSLLDQVTLMCYRFDNLSKGYSLSILRAVQIGGLLTLLLVGTGVALALRRERRRAATAVAGAGGAPTETTTAGTPGAAPGPHDGHPTGGSA